MKSRKYSKGQSSIEYLATYGWVILVVVVVGVVIWQSGILSMQKQIAPGKSGFSQVRPFDWVAQDTGDVNMEVINDAGTKLTITGVSGAGCGGGVGSGDVLPGGTSSLSLSGCSFDGGEGDYFRLKVTISYNNPASGITHASVGEIWGSLE